MKEKILSILLVGILIVGLTGCGDKNTSNKNSNSELNSNENTNANNLTCSGKTSFVFDVLLGKVDGSDEYTNIGFTEYSKGYLENGEYTFVYDDETLTSVIGKEIFNESFNAGITDEQIKEANEEGSVRIYRDSNNRMVFEYTLDKDDDMIKLLGDKNNLKEWLENNSNLTCK